MLESSILSYDISPAALTHDDELSSLRLLVPWSDKTLVPLTLPFLGVAGLRGMVGAHVREEGGERDCLVVMFAHMLVGVTVNSTSRSSQLLALNPKWAFMNCKSSGGVSLKYFLRVWKLGL